MWCCVMYYYIQLISLSLYIYILKHFVTSLIHGSVLSRMIFTSLSRREKDRARARSHFPRSNFAYIRESRGKLFTIIPARAKEMTRRHFCSLADYRRSCAFTFRFIIPDTNIAACILRMNLIFLSFHDTWIIQFTRSCVSCSGPLKEESRMITGAFLPHTRAFSASPFPKNTFT